MTTTLAGAAIADRVADVRRRVNAACERAGRDPERVTLIAVSKTRQFSDLLEAHAAGVRHFGENYVQEGSPKLLEARARGLGVTGHFIGGLQRNKVRAAVDAFDVVHSVDSERLLEAIAAAAERPVGVFLQVNLSGEASKGGLGAGDISSLLATAGRHSEVVEVLGLMAVPPAGTAEEARPWFRQLYELADDNGLTRLSMGMTGDFEVAIEEGATHIRVGQAIFGARP